MTAVVDTSVLIDHLRGVPDATALLRRHRDVGILHASEITRLEVLAGMRSGKETQTRSLLSVLQWHPVDESIADRAGQLGRTWLRSHRGIDGADLAIAATALALDVPLLTLNTRHFPMFEGLSRPY